MNELIKVREEQIGDGKIQTVNARDLHEFLGSKQEFAHWIKDRIQDFEEEKDFLIILSKRESKGIGRGKKEYHISLDMGKHIAMIERNEKGKEARKYFIECEKKLKEQIKLPKTYVEALRALANEVEEKEKIEVEKNKLQIETKRMKPKEEFFDAVTSSKDAVEMTKIAKVLDMGIGRNTLFEFLRNKKLLRSNNEPYQKYIDQELFRVIEQKYHVEGETRICFKTLVYQKGLNFIRQLLEEEYDTLEIIED